MDKEASNYNNKATKDDGTCEYSSDIPKVLVTLLALTSGGYYGIHKLIKKK